MWVALSVYVVVGSKLIAYISRGGVLQHSKKPPSIHPWAEIVLNAYGRAEIVILGNLLMGGKGSEAPMVCLYYMASKFSGRKVQYVKQMTHFSSNCTFAGYYV